jgi:hypothetical protein
MVDIFEAMPTEKGWGVWEHGVQRWAAHDGLSEEAARAIAGYLNQARSAPPRAERPVKPALVKIGGDWLTCEVHDWLRTPGTDRWEAKVVVWVDQDCVRQVDQSTRDRRRQRR